MTAPDKPAEYHCPAGHEWPNLTEAEAIEHTRDALRRVLAAMQIRHKFDEDDLRQIAADMGVVL